jgi:hypothetical protein
MKNLLNFTISVFLIGMVLTACAPLIPAVGVASAPTLNPSSTPPTTQREAQVQSVEIQVLQADPPRVNAVVRGSLTESCATLGQSQVQYASNTFRIAVHAVSPTDRGCAQVTTPFETTIALDTNGLGAGTYTVIANGVSAVFSLQSGSPAPTTAPTEVPTAVPTSHGCTDAAAFVSDVTIPDNTVLAPNTAFTKTWRLKNTGSCTWNSRYLVSYISGTTMTQSPGYWIVQQGQTVAPGQSVNISVGMSAPMQDGSYTSYWGLKKENGQFMPIQGGADGNSFYVKIQVPDTRPQGGNITAATIAIELEQGSGTVCTADATYFVHAYVTADGPTTASYEIGSTAGQIPAGNFQVGSSTALSVADYGSAVFDQGGTKTISLRFVGPYPHPDDITINLRVNGGEWHNTKLSCQ